MKTQKRIAYCSCGCWLNLESGDYMDDKGKFHNATALFCPKCGAAHPGEAFAARCIRKNREARLRNAIRQEKRRLKNEEFRHRIYFQSTLDNMLQARTILFVNPLSGTYGHDIEGS